jgi:hypothetical protein
MTLNKVTFSKMTLRTKVHSITAQSIMTLNKMALNKVTPRIRH